MINAHSRLLRRSWALAALSRQPLRSRLCLPAVAGRTLAISINPISRKGYRFKGTGRVLTEGPLFDDVLAFYRRRGVANEVRAIVLVEVARAMPLTSPTYDLGVTEQEVRERWERHYEALRRGESGAPTGE